MFASRSLLSHLLRGGLGLGALAAAVGLGPSHPLLALALVPAALIALRGCPTCWTIGLLQTIAARRGRGAPHASYADGRCEVHLPPGRS
jgi:hypothetical protein